MADVCGASTTPYGSSHVGRVPMAADASDSQSPPAPEAPPWPPPESGSTDTEYSDSNVQLIAGSPASAAASRENIIDTTLTKNEDNFHHYLFFPAPYRPDQGIPPWDTDADREWESDANDWDASGNPDAPIFVYEEEPLDEDSNYENQGSPKNNDDELADDVQGTCPDKNGTNDNDLLAMLHQLSAKAKKGAEEAEANLAAAKKEHESMKKFCEEMRLSIERDWEVMAEMEQLQPQMVARVGCTSPAGTMDPTLSGTRETVLGDEVGAGSDSTAEHRFWNPPNPSGALSPPTRSPVTYAVLLPELKKKDCVWMPLSKIVAALAGSDKRHFRRPLDPPGVIALPFS